MFQSDKCKSDLCGYIKAAVTAYYTIVYIVQVFITSLVDRHDQCREQ